jgi:hypothetical protein
MQTSSNGSSVGGTRSGAEYNSGLGMFFPNVAEVDRLAGGTTIRKFFIYNDHATDALISPSFWIQQEPTYFDEEIGLGFDDTNDDDSAQGNMTAWTATAVASVISSEADTRDITIYGKDGAGLPVQETLTLTGTTEVVGAQSFSVVYGAFLDSADATATVTVRQGSGGANPRGTIGPDFVSCFLWLSTAVSKGTGIRMDDLPAGESYGFWNRLTWPASTPGVRPNVSVIAVEEN